MNAETSALPEQARSLPLEASAGTADLVERMSEDLGLWETRVDAGLFLVALAVARGEEPVPAEEREPAEVTLGSLAEATGDEDIDHLAILDVIAEEPGELTDALAEHLPGWIEAGARLLGPRLEGADAVEATAEVVEIARDVR